MVPSQNASVEEDPTTPKYRWVYILRRRHVHAFLNGPTRKSYDPQTGAHIAVTLTGLLVFLLFLIIYHKVKRRFRSWTVDGDSPGTYARRPTALVSAAALSAVVVERRWPSPSLDLGRMSRLSIGLPRLPHNSTSAHRRSRTYSV